MIVDVRYQYQPLVPGFSPLVSSPSVSVRRRCCRAVDVVADLSSCTSIFKSVVVVTGTVPRTGFEPATCGLEARRSIH